MVASPDIFSSVRDLVISIGKGCNFACYGCQGEGRPHGSDERKLKPSIHPHDIPLILDSFPNLKSVRWGGIWTEPTLHPYGLAPLNRDLHLRAPNVTIFTITNGSTLPKDETGVPSYLTDILGYPDLDPDHRLVLSVDRHHAKAYERYHRHRKLPGEPPEAYCDRILAMIGYVSKRGLWPHLSINTVYARGEDPDEVTGCVRAQYGVGPNIAVLPMRLSVYARVQEPLLKKGSVVDLRNTRGFPAPDDPVGFVAREGSGPLIYYREIADWGYQRNGDPLPDSYPK